MAEGADLAPGTIEGLTPGTGEAQHDWGEWEVVKAATLTAELENVKPEWKAAEGFEVRQCKGCGAVETRITPALGPVKTDLELCVGAAKAAGFTDLDPKAWYMTMPDGNFPETQTLYLDYVVSKGYMSGYEGVGLFAPQDTVTRAMTATVIYRMANGVAVSAQASDQAADAETGFADVPAGQWYSTAIAWCAEQGITVGYEGEGRFGPDDPVTREQLATMIFRYCTKVKGQQPRQTSLSRFSDQAQISPWAAEGVAHCAVYGIVSGYADGTGRFGPQDTGTRAQLAKIVAVTAYMLE